MIIANIVLGHKTPTSVTTPGEPCWVTYTGRPARTITPDPIAQRRWRLASVREARRMQNPWKQHDPGTRRVAEAVFLGLALSSTDGPVAIVQRANGQLQRYPLERVSVQARYAVHDFSEHDMWSTAKLGDKHG